MKKWIYLIIAIVGFAVPYYFLISFIIENGMDFGLLLKEVFQTNGSTFFAVDVIISAIALILYIVNENKRGSIRFSWLAIAGTCTIGVSFGLPLYLFLREQSDSKLQTSDAATLGHAHGE